MKCPKCGYVSFDHLDSCKKCGRDLTEVKALLGIRTFRKRSAEPAPEVETAAERVPQEEVKPSPGEESFLPPEGLDEEFTIDDISFGEADTASGEWGAGGVDIGEEAPVVEKETSSSEAPADTIDFGDIDFYDDVDDITFEGDFGDLVEEESEEDTDSEDNDEGRGDEPPAGAGESGGGEVEPGAAKGRDGSHGGDVPAGGNFTAEAADDDQSFKNLFSKEFSSDMEDFRPVSVIEEADSEREEVSHVEEAGLPAASRGDVPYHEGGQTPLPFVDEGTLEGEEEGDANRVARNIEEVKKGGFFRRSVAFGLDMVVQCIILYAFLSAGLYALKRGASLTGTSVTVEQVLNLLGPLFLLTFVVSAGYFTFFHWSTGQTPGKMLLRLKVTATDGGPVSIGSALLRWFCYILSALPLMVGFFMILMNRQRQGLHDKLAGTYVVDARDFAAATLPIEEDLFDGEPADGGALPGETIPTGT